MPMQRCAAKLGENKNLSEPGMEAIADGNIDQAELARNGNRWFAPYPGQWIEPGTLTTGQDIRDDLWHDGPCLTKGFCL